MATTTPDPHRQSWPELVSRARAERAPAIDVRAAVQNAIAKQIPEPAPPDWTAALFELLRLPWARATFAASAAIAIALCFLGWQILSQELSDPIRLAMQTEAPSGPLFDAP